MMSTPNSLMKGQVWGHIITIGHSCFSLMIYSLVKRENCTGANPCGSLHCDTSILERFHFKIEQALYRQGFYLSGLSQHKNIRVMCHMTWLLSATVHRKCRVGCLLLYSCCSFRQLTRSIVLVTKYDIAIGPKSLALAHGSLWETVSYSYKVTSHQGLTWAGFISGKIIMENWALHCENTLKHERLLFIAEAASGDSGTECFRVWDSLLSFSLCSLFTFLFFCRDRFPARLSGVPAGSGRVECCLSALPLPP